MTINFWAFKIYKGKYNIIEFYKEKYVISRFLEDIYMKFPLIIITGASLCAIMERENRKFQKELTRQKCQCFHFFYRLVLPLLFSTQNTLLVKSKLLKRVELESVDFYIFLSL